jgi:predicted  nucleic acid-binding Zn-ribbon protein
MDRRKLAAAPDALERATKEHEFMQIRSVLNPTEREMTALVKRIEHLAETSSASSDEVAELCRQLAAKGLDTAEICGAAEIAIEFAERER